MTHIEALPVPPPGERVRFHWGLMDRPARVETIYGVTRADPHALVDIYLDDSEHDPMTGLGMLDQLEPLEGSDTEWARAYRYELAVHEALTAVGEEPVSGVDRARAVNCYLPAPGGGRLAVAVRHGEQAPTSKSVVEQVRALRRETPGVTGLLVVTAHEPRNPAPHPRARVVTWRKKKDTPALRRALRELRSV